MLADPLRRITSAVEARWLHVAELELCASQLAVHYSGPESHLQHARACSDLAAAEAFAQAVLNGKLRTEGPWH